MTPVRAELVGANVASAQGIVVTHPAPVLKLCRVLAEAGVDLNTPLHAYRGSTLCLTVRSIGEGAELRVDETSTPRLGRLSGFGAVVVPLNVRQRSRGDSPVRLNGERAP